MRNLSELVEFLVKSLVADPTAVRVRRIAGEGFTTYEAQVAPEDMGRVIGRQGRVINAIRTVVKAAAGGEEGRVTVNVVSA